MAHRVAAAYPQVRAQFLTCGEPEVSQRKNVVADARLSEAAAYETLVTSDADARV